MENPEPVAARKTPLVFRKGGITRPNYKEIVKVMLKEHRDVHLPSKAAQTALWKAIRREGYCCWSVKDDLGFWVVRLSHASTEATVNPLVEAKRAECRFGRYSKKIQSLLAGTPARAKTRQEAHYTSVAARYHIEKHYPGREFTIHTAPIGDRFDLLLEWKDRENGLSVS